MTRIAINGLGRIGRAALKIIIDTPGLELVTDNDIVPIENIINLLKYDAVYGRYDKTVEGDGENLIIGEKTIRYFSEKDAAYLPWSSLSLDVLLECTGVFTTWAELEKHIQAGAKYVILSAPAENDDVATVVHGVNTVDGNNHIFACASCTTNCITPVIEIVGRRIGIKKAIMATVHAYTASQAIVDSQSKRFERSLAGNRHHRLKLLLETYRRNVPHYVLPTLPSIHRHWNRPRRWIALFSSLLQESRLCLWTG